MDSNSRDIKYSKGRSGAFTFEKKIATKYTPKIILAGEEPGDFNSDLINIIDIRRKEKDLGEEDEKEIQ